MKTFLRHYKKENHNFWDYYNKVFCNALTLLSIADLDEVKRAGMVNKIVDFLSNETYIENDNLRHVRHMIARIGKTIDNETLITLLWVSIRREKYHDQQCLEAIHEVLESRNVKLALSDDDKKIIKEKFIEYGPEGKPTKINKRIVLLHSLIDDEHFQSEVSLIISDFLAEHFEFDFYYRATIFDVLKYDPLDFEKLLLTVMPSQTRRSMNVSYLGRPSDRYESVDDFH